MFVDIWRWLADVQGPKMTAAERVTNTYKAVELQVLC